jgi:hypothetical protein
VDVLIINEFPRRKEALTKKASAAMDLKVSEVKLWNMVTSTHGE